MEIGSNETIKQAVMAGLGIALISAHTIAAEVEGQRLVVLDVVGLPDMRRWFVVRPAGKRLMPASRVLRDFLAAEGRRFLPEVPIVEGDRRSSRTQRRRACKKHRSAS
jgi:LysR family transcriptional regulator, low CO2-responsive transcriptional regulator